MKILNALLIAAAILSPVQAQARDCTGYYPNNCPGFYDEYRGRSYDPPAHIDRYDRDGRYRGYDRYRYRDRDSDDVVVPLVIGTVLGVIIGSAVSQPRERDPRPVYRYDRNCDCYRR